jgi:hypothetical protein
MADRGTAIIAAMPLITADTPQRITTGIMVTGTGERRLSPLQIGLKPHQVRRARHDGWRRQELWFAIRHPK